MARPKQSQYVLARQLGISRQAVGALVKRGMPLSLPAAQKWRAENLDENRTAPTPLRHPIEPPSTDPRIAAARLERAEALARISKMQADELAGTLINREKVRIAVVAIAHDTLQAYSVLEGHMAPLLHGGQLKALRNELHQAQVTLHQAMQRRLGKVAPETEPEAGKGTAPEPVAGDG